MLYATTRPDSTIGEDKANMVWCGYGRRTKARVTVRGLDLSIASARGLGWHTLKTIRKLTLIFASRSPISGNMKRRRIASPPVRSHYDLDILVKCDQKAQQSLNLKLLEITPQHLGDIGLGNTQEIGGFGLLETTVFHDRVNLEHEMS